MSKPAAGLEDLLLRRLIQDHLNKLRGDPKQLLQAAEILADSLVQSRAAAKWLADQRLYAPVPESSVARPRSASES